jgi:hypothetical protein
MDTDLPEQNIILMTPTACLPLASGKAAGKVMFPDCSELSGVQ